MKKNVTGQNFKVLESLKSLFKFLDDHKAIVGRDNYRIVIELNKILYFKRDEFHEIYRKSVLVAPNGSMNIFSDMQIDGKINILLLNISPSLSNNDNVFSKFPAFSEVKALIESIPFMSKEQSERFEVLHNAIVAELFSLIAESGNELREALIGGRNKSSEGAR